MILLDTNICIGILHANPKVLGHVQVANEVIGIPIMRKFGDLKASLERQGRRVDDADVIIAATALTLDATLATGNTGHFARFDGLKIENWFS